jgi:hypothetical protein
MENSEFASANPLAYVAKIGLPDHIDRDFDLLQDALCLIDLQDQPLFDEHDRSEAMQRAQRMRLLGGTDDDVDGVMQSFVHEVVEAKKGEPRRRPFYSPRNSVKPLSRQALAEARRKREQKKPTALDDVSVGSGCDWTDMGQDNLLAQIVDWILATSRHPNLPLAVAAAFSTLSAVCGRRLYGPSGVGLNTYIVGLGPTGVGKEAALDAIGRILHESQLGDHHGTLNTYTISGLEQTLIDAHAVVATVDEISTNVFSRMLSPRAGADQSGMKGFLQSMYGKGIDSAPYKLVGRSRGGMRKSSLMPEAMPVTEVPRPSFSLFGVDTPEAFYMPLTEAHVADGFLNRFMVINAAKQEGANALTATVPLPESIKDCLREIEACCYGNGFDLTTKEKVIHPRRIPWDEHAEEHHAALSAEIKSVMDACPAHHKLMVRIPDNALRIATLIAISRAGPWDAAVTWADVEEGAAMAIEAARTAIDGVSNHMRRTEYEGYVNEAKAFLQDSPSVSHSDFVRKFQHLKTHDRNVIITQLQEAQVLKCVKTKAARGPAGVSYEWVG